MCRVWTPEFCEQMMGDWWMGEKLISISATPMKIVYSRVLSAFYLFIVVIPLQDLLGDGKKQLLSNNLKQASTIPQKG